LFNASGNVHDGSDPQPVSGQVVLKGSVHALPEKPADGLRVHACDPCNLLQGNGFIPMGFDIPQDALHLGQVGRGHRQPEAIAGKPGGSAVITEQTQYFEQEGDPPWG
jgi:hypothetical protein